MVDRYARQRSIAEVGDAGQAALGRAQVCVEGDGEDARIAAHYLAGAGVGRLTVHRSWVDECRARNSTIDVEAGAPDGPLVVVVGAGRHAPPVEALPLERGARAARWAIARVLSS